MSVSVCIAGDVVPQERTARLFEEQQAEYLFGEVMPAVAACDIKIVNLEVPIISGRPTPIRKVGPALHTTAATAATLQRAGFNVFTLANNHFRDQGDDGVYTTLHVCDDLNIAHIGGGRNLHEARAILYVEQGEETVALINACETEFSIASSVGGGANPLDLIAMSDDMHTARQKADHIVVILHGGIERYPYPTPRMKRQYRHIVDVGADAVVNAHQHCFSGYEEYRGKPIFYGIGNFCFDREGERGSTWNKGYMVVLNLDKEVDFKTIPYLQCADEPKVKRCPDDYYRRDIEQINAVISDDYLLAQRLTDFVLSNEKNLLANILPTNNRYVKGLYRRGLLGKMYTDKQLLHMKNLFCCEAHSDVMKHLLSILSQ